MTSRPLCPIPVENRRQNNPSNEIELRVNTPNLDSGEKENIGSFSRISGKFSAFGANLQNAWRQARAFRDSSSRADDVREPSMPDIVNDVMEDDEDDWSEDSFDSCSIGYEDETRYSREGSLRQSARQSQFNDSKRKKNNNGKIKRLSHPSVPPPPPPAQNRSQHDDREHTAVVPTVSSSTFSSNSSCQGYSVPVRLTAVTDDSIPKQYNENTYQDFRVVRAAPVPPVSANKSQLHRYPPTELSTLTAALKTDQVCSLASKQVEDYDYLKRSPLNRQHPPLPSLPKLSPANKTDLPKVKPVVPAGPKPVAKPHLLPKLKIGLHAPPATTGHKTPDTTMTVLSATPGVDSGTGPTNVDLFRSVREPDDQDTDNSNLSIKARRALLEAKARAIPNSQRR